MGSGKVKRRERETGEKSQVEEATTSFDMAKEVEVERDRDRYKANVQHPTPNHVITSYDMTGPTWRTPNNTRGKDTPSGAVFDLDFVEVGDVVGCGCVFVDVEWGGCFDA